MRIRPLLVAIGTAFIAASTGLSRTVNATPALPGVPSIDTNTHLPALSGDTATFVATSQQDFRGKFLECSGQLGTKKYSAQELLDNKDFLKLVTATFYYSAEGNMAVIPVFKTVTDEINTDASGNALIKDLLEKFKRKSEVAPLIQEAALAVFDSSLEEATRTIQNNIISTQSPSPSTSVTIQETSGPVSVIEWVRSNFVNAAARVSMTLFSYHVEDEINHLGLTAPTESAGQKAVSVYTAPPTLSRIYNTVSSNTNALNSSVQSAAKSLVRDYLIGIHKTIQDAEEALSAEVGEVKGHKHEAPHKETAHEFAAEREKYLQKRRQRKL
jgi:hypothetical protein